MSRIIFGSWVKETAEIGAEIARNLFQLNCSVLECEPDTYNKVYYAVKADAGFFSENTDAVKRTPTKVIEHAIEMAYRIYYQGDKSTIKQTTTNEV